MKPILSAAALLLIAAPAFAQNMPKLDGQRAGYAYCRYRASGISHDAAVQRALIQYSSKTLTEPSFQMDARNKGTRGILRFVQTANLTCPRYSRDFG